jgi:hypothetical protein
MLDWLVRWKRRQWRIGGAVCTLFQPLVAHIFVVTVADSGKMYAKTRVHCKSLNLIYVWHHIISRRGNSVLSVSCYCLGTSCEEIFWQIRYDRNDSFFWEPSKVKMIFIIRQYHRWMAVLRWLKINRYVCMYVCKTKAQNWLTGIRGRLNQETPNWYLFSITRPTLNVLLLLLVFK